MPALPTTPPVGPRRALLVSAVGVVVIAVALYLFWPVGVVLGLALGLVIVLSLGRQEARAALAQPQADPFSVFAPLGVAPEAVEPRVLTATAVRPAAGTTSAAPIAIAAEARAAADRRLAIAQRVAQPEAEPATAPEPVVAQQVEQARPAAAAPAAVRPADAEPSALPPAGEPAATAEPAAARTVQPEHLRPVEIAFPPFTGEVPVVAEARPQPAATTPARPARTVRTAVPSVRPAARAEPTPVRDEDDVRADLDRLKDELGDDYPDFARAARLVVSTQYASAARLQRDLQLPYSRARRLLADLESQHFVGPATGTLPRQVLVPEERLAEVERLLAGV